MKHSRPFVLATASLFPIALCLTAHGQSAVRTLAGSSATSSSSAIPQWEVDAGGKMVFEVASVKENRSDADSSTNVPLGPGEVFAPTGGLFAATKIPLWRYIQFAYKLTFDEVPIIRTQLPKWADTEYDIQARAPGNPAKDQYRLMMQSLLEERFKLGIHYETRQLPVYAISLVNPGRTGPQLKPHADHVPCSTDRPEVGGPGAGPTPSPVVEGGFPRGCGGVLGMMPSVPGRYRIGARNVSVAIVLSAIAGNANLDRPVLDRTGLTGIYDFSLEWAPEPDGAAAPGVAVLGPDSQTEATGPSAIEAVREQLGLRIEPQTGRVSAVVIDHIEEPSPN